ncbi:MAG: hypothetical protein ACREOP_11665, partial [Thermodesulfobacteriota bacterium]
ALAVIVLTLSFFTIGGCGGGGGGGNGGVCPETNTGIEVCDPDAGPFSLVIDNGFFPMLVGSETVLEGTDDEGVFVRVETTVPGDTQMVAGVNTRVLVETEFGDGELTEISRNFYAQAPDGTVCYFGEDVDIFEDGEIVAHDGAWRAGEDGNRPGIQMPGDPEPGMKFQQEFAPGIAEDQTEILALGEEIDVPAGMFSDTLTAEDCNALDGTMDLKVYVDNIGLAIDEFAELIEFSGF